MKRKASIKLLAGITALSAFATITATVAWFIPSASIEKEDNPISGSSSGAYFAYGNGIPTTQEHPENRVYGITVPRHLYNLAWLQYLGYFNLESENGKQYYFELGDNIDMTGWTLPPIGTEDHPFIGNFNGNGYVIKGLTVSNQFSDFDKHPGEASAQNFTQPHIMGFFGVIGDYNDEYGSTAYSSAANSFTNTGLTGLTIKTYLKDTLMGIAAGYVEADMKNIAVDASTINIDNNISETTTSYGGFTDNISDYSLVGYTTNTKQVTKVDETIYDVNVSSGHEFNATEQGDGATGWGGSIDMMSVTKRLQTIRDTVSDSRFAWKKSREIHNDVPTGDYTTSGTQSGTNNYTRMVNSNDEIGHFNFITGTSDVNSRYALLGGGHLEVDEIYELAEHNGRFITDGTNYLCLSGTSLTNGTDPDTATLWTFGSYSTGVYYIYTQYNGTTYYLNYNYGALNTSTTTGSTRRWQVDDSGTYRDIKYNGGTNYHLTYSNGWTLSNVSGNPYYLIHDQNGHYMGTPSNQIPSNVTSANALKFGYTSTGNTRGYYNQSDTSYYLKYRRASNPIQIGNNNITATYRLYSTTSATTCMSTGNGTGYLRTTTKNADTTYTDTYYVRWNNNAWTTTTTASQATQITIDYINPFNSILLKSTDEAEPHIGPDEQHTDQQYHMNYEDDDVTYFPLNTVNNTSDFRPSDNNTAYVVGGSSLTPNVTYNNNVTNVRFGYYPIADYIDDDYNVSTGKFTSVYTINNSMQKVDITNSTAYEKLDTAKTNLGGVLKKDGTNVYGLHFMAAEISMNALTTADYVKVNKKEYYDYELPVNSIDFNLKELGYINFMAGSYFPGNSYQTRNDSFFALYQIERLDSSPNKINRIFEVLNIYKHSTGTSNYSYVYQLKDTVTGTVLYTKPYKVIDAEGNKEWLYDTEHDYANNQYETELPANYNLVFNCACIKKNSLSQNDFMYHAWYFEIPMNDGEFCLGSDASGVGSYLMYLDIGANASKYQRTIFTEHFSISQTVTSHPDGVALVSLPTTYSKEVATIDIEDEIDYEDTACVRIMGGYKNTFVIDRNGSDVTLTRSDTAKSPPIYQGENVTKIHDSGSSSQIAITPISSTTKDIKRLTYYDVNVNLGSLMKTIITDTKTDNGAYVRTIEQRIYSGTDDSATPSTTYVYNGTTDQRDNMKIYNTSNGVRYTSANLINQTTLPIGTVSTTPNIVVRIVQDGGAGYTELIELEANIDNSNTSGKYYLFKDYIITITPNGADVTITVVSRANGGKVVYYGTTQVTAAEQVITISVPSGS